MNDSHNRSGQPDIVRVEGGHAPRSGLLVAVLVLAAYCGCSSTEKEEPSATTGTSGSAMTDVREATMSDLIAEYRRCVEMYAAIDYAEPATVDTGNRAVGSMYEIVEEMDRRGADAIEEFAAPLLDDPEAARWIPQQLLERCKVSAEMETRCLALIEERVKGDDIEAMMAEVWLKEYRSKPRPDK